MDKQLALQLKEKYPQLLCNMFTTAAIPIAPYGIECAAGWYELIDRTLAELQKLDQEVYISQIKEKFGLLRIYTSARLPEVHKITDAAEAQSQYVCEDCGGLGKRLGDNWIRTLCAVCNDLFLSKRSRN